MLRSLRFLIVFVGAVAVGDAAAGHELTFYPSFYPQEITLRSVDPDTAARLLAKNALHAYVGADPFAKSGAPSHVTIVESLGGLAIVRFTRASPAFATAGARCAAAAAVTKALAAAKGDYVVLPYPVTPLHADYLAHFDLVETALHKAEQEGGGARPRILARGRWAEALARAGFKVTDEDADATLEEVDVTTLLEQSRAPAWNKTGWQQAYAVYADGIADEGRRRAVDEIFARRTTATFASEAERLNLERRLVMLLLRGCERVPVGYTIRREAVNVEYSAGVENVAYDAARGLNSAMFVRTVKLKDFPWNGWLQLGIGSKPTAAWNPIAGFSDPAGRLVWSALADPPLLQEPRGSTWIPSRVRMTAASSASPVDVPADALTPDPRTGVLRPAGRGVVAGSRLVYRVLASKFHDETKMGVADLLYPVSFAFRVSAKDPAVARATATLRSELVAVRVVRIETDIQDLGELQVIRDVPLVEVYLKHAVDPAYGVAVAPPWSAVPWQLTTLMEEAVERGYAAFSEAEAKRRGVPWLDLARDRKLQGQLTALAATFERKAYVPDSLRGFVTVEQAQQRWAALRRFARTHGHLMVTNGPYRLGKWSGDAVVMPVFRDFSYPVGVGTYDRYAWPLRAWAARVERRGDRLEIEADVETVSKSARSYKLVREPFRPAPAGERLLVPTLTARYVVVGSGDEVVTAGVSEQRDGARLVVDLKGRLKPGAYRLALALALDENLLNSEVRVIPYRVAD